MSELEIPLPGGNIGGAVRVGDTVRRPSGPWTPAVHALLGHLHGRVPHIPTVLGFDHRGREVLRYLPGRVLDLEVEHLTAAQVASMVSWTRGFHDAMTDFVHPGPWRMWPVAEATMIGHNDLAAYNLAFDGDDVVGVFDWDLAGPTTALFELAFLAWNAVPLWRDSGVARTVSILELIASSYAGGFTAREILRAVPARIQVMIDGVPPAAAAGDPGMANLVRGGNVDQARAAVAGLRQRIPAVERALD